MNRSILLPVDLSTFINKFVKDPTQLEEILTKFEINLVEKPLVKKRFGKKTVYTLEVNVGHCYHRALFDLATIDDKETYVLRSFAWMHHYNAALKWAPFGKITHEDLPSIYMQSVPLKDQINLNEAEERFMIYDRGQWRDPTLHQSNLLKTEHYPQLIIGAPGSGKTLVVMGRFQELVLNHWENGTGVLKLLYLAENPTLLKRLKQSWSVWEKENLPREYNKAIVSFLTPEEYFNYYVSTQANHHLVSDETVIKELQLILKKDYEPRVFTELCNKAWVLYRDAEYNLSYEQSGYKEQGDKRSFYSMDEKPLIYPVFIKLLQKIKQQSWLHLKLSPMLSTSKEEHYDLIAFDETQKIEVKLLLDMLVQANYSRIMYLGDSFQKGATHFSSLPELGPILYSHFSIKLYEHTLPKSLRLKPKVAQLANEIVLLHSALNQGLPDALSYSSITAASVDDGHFIDNNDLDETSKNVVCRVDENHPELFKNISNDAEAAVIVLNEEDVGLASNFISGVNVFTVNQAHGIDFSRVGLFLSQGTLEQFASISKLIEARNITPETELKEYLNQSPEKKAPSLELLSDLLIAISRTYGPLLVYWEKPSSILSHKLKYFLPRLERHFDESPDKIQERISSPEDWLAAVHRYFMVDASTQALGVLQNIFNLTLNEAQQYQRQCQQNTEINTLDSFIQWRDALRDQSKRSVLTSLTSTLAKLSSVESKTNSEVLPSKSISEEPVPESRMTHQFTPFSQKVVDWIEDLYQNIASMANIKTLLERPKVIQIMFGHKMNNGYRLWENLFLNNKLDSFVQFVKNSAMKDKLASLVKEGICIAKEEKNPLLLYCLYDPIIAVYSGIAVPQLSLLCSDLDLSSIIPQLPSEKKKQAFMYRLNNKYQNVLQKKSYKNKKDADSIIVTAFVNDDKEIVNLFLSLGMNFTELLIKAIKEDNCILVEALSPHCDLDDPITEEGETPTFIAAESGSNNLLEFFKKNGVNMNKPRYDCMTPVYVAAQNGHERAVFILAKAGVDLSAPYTTTQQEIITLYKQRIPQRSWNLPMLIDNFIARFPRASLDTKILVTPFDIGVFLNEFNVLAHLPVPKEDPCNEQSQTRSSSISSIFSSLRNIVEEAPEHVRAQADNAINSLSEDAKEIFTDHVMGVLAGKSSLSSLLQRATDEGIMDGSMLNEFLLKNKAP